MPHRRRQFTNCQLYTSLNASFFFIVIAQILPLLISLILVTFQPGYFFSAPITAAADVGKLFLVSRTVFWLPRKRALTFNGAAFSEKIAALHALSIAWTERRMAGCSL